MNNSIIRLIDKFRAVANSHPQINFFGFGPRYEIQDASYPLLWIVNDNSHTIVQSSDGSYRTTVYRFTLRLADLVNNQTNVYNASGENSNNGLDVISDTAQILHDIFQYINNSQFFENYQLTSDIDLQPFFHEDNGDVNGHEMDIEIIVTNTNDCNNPLEESANLIPGEIFPVGTSLVLNDISDVNITNIFDEQFLQYDSATSKWVNITLNATGTYDTTLGSLETPETVGGILAGTTAASLSGSSLTEMWDDLLFPTVLASITTPVSVSLSVSGTTGNVEIGTTLANTLTATFIRGTITDGDTVTTQDLVGPSNQYTFTGTGISSTAQAGNSLIISVTAVAGDNDWEVTTDYDIGTGEYFDNKGNAGTNLDASRVAASTSDNDSTPDVIGYYKLFHSTGGTTPTNSAEVRALSSELDLDNSFILNTGSTDTKFIIILPQGRTITSVIDLDALNANITANYVLLGTISVDDAGGSPRNYNQYEMNLGAPYSSNHRHSMTFTG